MDKRNHDLRIDAPLRGAFSSSRNKAAGTKPSTASTETSVKSTDSENTVIHKTVVQWFKSAESPSIYQKKSFGSFRSGPSEDTQKTLVEDQLEEEGESQSMNEDDNAVWWDSEDDPENPMNWPKWKKGLNFFVVFMICFVSPFASSVIAPAMVNIVFEFREPDAYLSAFVISIYVLGYALGPLIVGPLSEVYGRLPLYHVCNVIFVVFTCMCAVTKHLHVLAVMRFFAGCGGSSAFVLGPATVADLVRIEKRGAMYAVLGMAYNLGPAVAPTVGSYVSVKGWRWIFWITAMMGAGCTVATFALSESYQPILLRRKAQKLRKETHNQNLRSRLDIDNRLSQRQIILRAMLRPLKMLLFCPDVLLVSFLTAVGYGYMYMLYTTLPTTMLTVYAWPLRTIGLTYLGSAVGNLLAMMIGGPLSDVIVKRRAAKGDAKPENRLLLMIYFWPLVTVGVILYGWSAQKVLPWQATLAGTAIFGMGSMSAILFCGTYVVDAYTLHSASAAAATTVLRALLGGLVPLFANKMYEKLEVAWMFSILGLVALAFAPIPYFFYRHGESLRRRFNVPL